MATGMLAGVLVLLMNLLELTFYAAIRYAALCVLPVHLSDTGLYMENNKKHGKSK